MELESLEKMPSVLLLPNGEIKNSDEEIVIDGILGTGIS